MIETPEQTYQRELRHLKAMEQSKMTNAAGLWKTPDKRAAEEAKIKLWYDKQRARLTTQFEKAKKQRSHRWL